MTPPIWKELGAALRLPGTPDTLFYQLRLVYYKFLLSFEHKYQVMRVHNKGNSSSTEEASAVSKLKSTWARSHEEEHCAYQLAYEYLSEAEYKAKKKRRKRKLRRKQRHLRSLTPSKKRRRSKQAVPLPLASVDFSLDDYSEDDLFGAHLFYASRANKRRRLVTAPHQRSHHDWLPKDRRAESSVTRLDTHNVHGKGCEGEVCGMQRHFSAYWSGRHMVIALTRSLQSRVSGSVNWALNRLLLLSYNTKASVAEPLLIKHHAQPLLDALMALMPTMQDAPKHTGQYHFFTKLTDIFSKLSNIFQLVE